MPLSPPVPRQPHHTRTIECSGYRRDDGLWDIEGHLVDTKPYEVPTDDRVVPAGEPMHEMWIRLTVDLDLTVHGVEAVTDWGPYHGCGSITPAFQQLEGLSIRSGWTLKVRELLGGVRGCTHLVELLGPVATTAFQTVYAARERVHPAGSDGRRPGLIDSCHMYAVDGPIVKRRWPTFHIAAAPLAAKKVEGQAG